MVTKEFKSYKDLAMTIAQQIDAVDDGISIVCFYEDARHVIKELIKTDKVEVGGMELQDSLWDGYDKEFYVTVWKDFKTGVPKITCEKGYNKTHEDYLYDCQSITYIFDNCHSRVIQRIQAAVVYETVICEDNKSIPVSEFGKDKTEKMKEYHGCEDEADFVWNDCDDMHGFTTTKATDNGVSSFSFYSSDKELVNQMAKKYYC